MTVAIPKLVARLRRAPKDRNPRSWELVAEVDVNVTPINHSGIADMFKVVSEKVMLGFDKGDHDYCWELWRKGGTLFERRRVRDFRLEPDPENKRASDMARDWPCSTQYRIWTPGSNLRNHCIRRNPKTLEFETVNGENN
jgi:hypothetical protein